MADLLLPADGEDSQEGGTKLKSFGPHAFLLSLRSQQDGDLVPGVSNGCVLV